MNQTELIAQRIMTKQYTVTYTQENENWAGPWEHSHFDPYRFRYKFYDA